MLLEPLKGERRKISSKLVILEWTDSWILHQLWWLNYKFNDGRENAERAGLAGDMNSCKRAERFPVYS